MFKQLYIPPAFVEALGRAAIARAQLELCFDVVIVLLAAEPQRFAVSRTDESFEAKTRYLATVSRSKLLKHTWWQELRRIAAHAEHLHGAMSDAATGVLYSRGAGPLGESLRPTTRSSGVAFNALSNSTAAIEQHLHGARRRLLA